MNELQTKEFEILKHFIETCEKLDLTYYLVCGSALGAVKYKGFIPWDDDIDVAMPRKDYDRFLNEGSDLLPDHLFLQNYQTDNKFPKIFSKLRDSRTTYIESAYAKIDIHHGVFIDVFALDGYPVDKREIKWFERKKKNYLRLTSCALSSSGSLKSRTLRQILRLLGYHKITAKYLIKYENMLRSYSESDFYCNYGNFRGVMEITPKEVYGHGVYATFENLRVRIPEKFDAYLREKYGDYTLDPPNEERVGHHNYSLIDLNTSYKDLMSK